MPIRTRSAKPTRLPEQFPCEQNIEIPCSALRRRFARINLGTEFPRISMSTFEWGQQGDGSFADRCPEPFSPLFLETYADIVRWLDWRVYLGRPQSRASTDICEGCRCHTLRLQNFTKIARSFTNRLQAVDKIRFAASAFA